MLFRGRRARRVMVIGLDCAAPELVFDLWRDELPNFGRLMDGGVWGELESTIPAITVPAWSSMLSSRDPGVLGIYGFRNRADYSYYNMYIAYGDSVQVPRIWDWLGEAGKNSIIVGVPQTYPVRPLAGEMVSGFLTPDRESEFAYPALLKYEVLKVVPDYEFDVHNFRTDDKDHLLDRIYRMTEGHFRLIEHLLETRRDKSGNPTWDFFMFVEIGVDRIHHGFWKYHDPRHPLYDPSNRFRDAIADYYKRIDELIGRVLERLPDDTVIMVVSDHGAQPMMGGICVNEWLWRNGYLTLKHDPPAGDPVPFERVEVDWGRTVAWGAGGYYGRVFMNVRGREPEGIIPPERYEAVRDELAEALKSIPAPDGSPLDTTVFKPQRIYSQVNGIPPDLVVYFGGMAWRAVGSFGHGRWYTNKNDTGPDDANHASNGLFILHDPKSANGGGNIGSRSLMDVAPTVLHLLGVRIPKEMQGRVIVS